MPSRLRYSSQNSERKRFMASILARSTTTKLLASGCCRILVTNPKVCTWPYTSNQQWKVGELLGRSWFSANYHTFVAVGPRASFGTWMASSASGMKLPRMFQPNHEHSSFGCWSSLDKHPRMPPPLSHYYDIDYIKVWEIIPAHRCYINAQLQQKLKSSVAAKSEDTHNAITDPNRGQVGLWSNTQNDFVTILWTYLKLEHTKLDKKANIRGRFQLQ